jgi:ammonium transporter Rh
MQIIHMICYGLFTTYDQESGAVDEQTTNTINHYYPFFQDVHIMIFIGFGFLMTFMYKYSFGSVGYNFLLSAITIQQSILICGFMHCLFENHWEKIHMNIQSLITGDFAAGAILISFGALLGKASLSQLLIMIPCELIFYALNETIGVIHYEAVDMGGSMYVHTFGAYFGLAVSYVISNKEKIASAKDRFLSSRESDLFAMIGTLFLFAFWPSFNGALAIGNSQHRVVINTVLSLTNSCVFGFIISKLLRGKFDMVDIQNATLAGGVAVGSSADLVIEPCGALVIGAIAGSASVAGYYYLSPFMERKFGIHDSCGVHNLHGMPGVMGGVIGAISAAAASDTVYGDSITEIFAGRATRTAFEQGGYQMAAVVTTLAFSVGGGLVTGKICSYVDDSTEYGTDKHDWETPEEHEDQDEGEAENDSQVELRQL